MLSRTRIELIYVENVDDIHMMMMMTMTVNSLYEELFIGKYAGELKNGV